MSDIARGIKPSSYFLDDEERAWLRKRLKGKCLVCQDCDGRACIGLLPGLGGIGDNGAFIRNITSLDGPKSKVFFSAITNNADHVKINSDFLHEIHEKTRSVPEISQTDNPVLVAPMTGADENLGASIDELEFQRSLAFGAAYGKSFYFAGDGFEDYKLLSGLQAGLESGRPFGVILKPFVSEILLEKARLIPREATIVGVDIDSVNLLTMTRKKALLSLPSADLLKSLAKLAGKSLLVKGVADRASLDIALEAGAKFIMLGNHGGRVSEKLPGLGDIVGEIAPKIPKNIVIIGEGGIRNPQDLQKIQALGADFGACGRPLALAALYSGAYGVAQMLEYLNPKNENKAYSSQPVLEPAHRRDKRAEKKAFFVKKNDRCENEAKLDKSDNHCENEAKLDKRDNHCENEAKLDKRDNHCENEATLAENRYFSRKKVLFIPHGDEKIGSGHIYRSLKLAKYLEEFPISFEGIFQVPDNVMARSLLEGKGIKTANNEGEIDLGPGDIVILDRNDNSLEDIKSFKERGINVISFDDNGDGLKLLDISIDGNKKIQENINDERAYGPIKLYGPDYFLLDPAFSRPINRQFPPIAKSLLIAMGGTDTLGYTGFFMEKVEFLTKTFEKIKIVAGPGVKGIFPIGENKSQKVPKDKIQILAMVDNMAEIMESSDIILGCGGIIMVEAASMGLPAIILSGAKHQNILGKRAQEKGHALFCGQDRELALEKLALLARDPVQRAKMGKIGRETIDGRGIFRIGGAIFQLLNKS